MLETPPLPRFHRRAPLQPALGVLIPMLRATLREAGGPHRDDIGSPQFRWWLEDLGAAMIVDDLIRIMAHVQSAAVGPGRLPQILRRFGVQVRNGFGWTDQGEPTETGRPCGFSVRSSLGTMTAWFEFVATLRPGGRPCDIGAFGVLNGRDVPLFVAPLVRAPDLDPGGWRVVMDEALLARSVVWLFEAAVLHAAIAVEANPAEAESLGGFITGLGVGLTRRSVWYP